MSFKPEDGSGLPDANSFVSVIEADDYWALRGEPDWAPQERKEAMLIRATDWINSEFATSFKGTPLTERQSLAYPRDVVGIPEALKRATFELARVAVTTPLYNTSTGTDRQVIEKKVGPLTTKYAVPTVEQATANRKFPFLSLILASLLIGGGGFSVKLRRV